jgi:hypothetical protein
LLGSPSVPTAGPLSANGVARWYNVGMSEGQKSKQIALWVLGAIAIYAIPMGFLALPVGLFVGQHILVPAICHLLVGLAAILLYRMVQSWLEQAP